MISRIRGILLTRELDRVEVMTPGGVAYDIAIPRSVYERLPHVGKDLELRTYQLVREDAVLLFGFLDEVERTLELGAGRGEHLEWESLTAAQRRGYHMLELRANLCQVIRERHPEIRHIFIETQSLSGARREAPAAAAQA